MYGEIDETKLGKTSVPNWRHICPKTKILGERNPHVTAVGIIVVHLFVELW